MPRKARIDAPGAVHHIIIRGIERRSIFRDDLDRERFLEKLDAVLLESGSPCFAWVLMRNHVHLLLRSGRVPLAMVMRRLLTSYAMYFNRRYRRHGQLFQKIGTPLFSCVEFKNAGVGDILNEYLWGRP